MQSPCTYWHLIAHLLTLHFVSWKLQIYANTVADPGIHRGGALPLGGDANIRFWQIFPKNAHEIERIKTLRGDTHPKNEIFHCNTVCCSWPLTFHFSHIIKVRSRPINLESIPKSLKGFMCFWKNLNVKVTSSISPDSDSQTQRATDL